LIPLVELVVVPCGLVGALLAAIHPLLGWILLAVAERGAEAALWVGALFRSWAPVFHVRFPNLLETVTLMAGGALGLRAIAKGSDRPRWIAGGAAVLVGIAATSLIARDVLRRNRNDLEVTFLDVGQGDAALVQGPGGFTALVDGGGTHDGSFDPGERVIEPYLRTLGVNRLDLVVLSHPHPDHMNGLARVLHRVEVGALWTSGDDGRNPAYRDLIATARARGVLLPEPERVDKGSFWLEPIGPWLGDHIAVPPGVSVNDASLVVRVGFGARSVLFSGDVEADGEAELVGRGAAGLPIRSDVLKVPHHGSRTSSTEDLLDAVGPRLAVISLGRSNRFSFPAPEVLDRYRQRGIEVLRTDRHGALSVTISVDGIRTTCARGCR
jgi:competence protein ComEC